MIVFRTNYSFVQIGNEPIDLIVSNGSLSAFNKNRLRDAEAIGDCGDWRIDFSDCSNLADFLDYLSVLLSP